EGSATSVNCSWSLSGWAGIERFRWDKALKSRASNDDRTLREIRGPRLIRQQIKHTQHTGGVNVSLLARYRESVQALLDDVYATNHDAIERAAEILCNAIAEDRLVHVFGPGAHSYIGAEEMFYRAGGLACINAILDPGVSMERSEERRVGKECGCGGW